MNNRMKSLATAVTPRVLFIGCLALFVSIPLATQAQSPFAGAQTCAKCHGSENSGSAFHIWQASKHAGAFRTLENVSGNKDERHGLWIITMGRGDRYGLPTPATESPYCLPCHTTAFASNPQRISPTFDPKDGVQCEACHGPGSAHAELETVKAARQAIPAQEVPRLLEIARFAALQKYAGEKEIEERCKTCHDGMCGDFDFEKMWPAIRHSRPIAEGKSQQ